MTSQMILGIDLRRKDESRRIDAMGQSLATQIDRGRFVRAKQPQDAVLDSVQEPHPDVERCRRDLLIAVEAAEDEGLFRQSGFAPRRDARRNSPLGVIDLDAFRKPHDMLAVEYVMATRQHDFVSDQVVDEVSTHRRKKTDVGRLDRCWTESENVWSRALGISAEINENVHIELMQELGNLVVSLSGNVQEAIKGTGHACTDLAAVISPDGNAKDIKAISIVQLEQLDRQHADRMVAEVCRKIGQLDLVGTR